MSRLLPLFLLTVLLATGCGSQVKPNRDAELASKVIDSARLIFEDYDRKDFDAVRGHAAPEFTTLRVDTGFEKAKHEVSVRWVNITPESVRLILGWEAAWTVQGNETSSGGQCTMVFDMTSAKLIGLEGDHPFAVPTPKSVPDTPKL